MKILAFSDLHRDAAGAEAIVNESRGVDVVVGAGDFASCGLGHEDTLDVLRRIAVPFVLVPGNHDDLGALREQLVDVFYLHLLVQVGLARVTRRDHRGFRGRGRTGPLCAEGHQAYPRDPGHMGEIAGSLSRRGFR